MAYSSNYYDPQKAHEYYMKHRKLKGRRTLNEKGKAAKATVKAAMDAEKKATIQKLKDAVDSKVTEVKGKIQALEDARKKELAGFKAESEALANESKRIAAMPKGPAKDKARAELKKKRADLKGKRESSKQAYAKVQETVKGARQAIAELKKQFTSARKDITAQYKASYESEVEKIKADSSMTKVAGSSGKKKKSKK